ncbi:MAG: hypothetical protein AAGI07_02840 [Bacteroidota bacterium]
MKTYYSLQKIFLLVTGVSILSTAHIFAQDRPLKKMTLKNVRFHVGSFFDTYDNLSPEGLLSMIKGANTSGFKLSDYEEAYRYARLEGGNIGFDLVFTPTKQLYNNKVTQEIRLGASVNLAREAMIDMSKITENENADPYYTGDFVGLCIIENEFVLQASYIFNFSIVESKWQLYVGPGANFGSTFSNDFVFIGLSDELIPAKNSHFFRAYTTLGTSLQFNRWRVDLESIYGLGAQIVHQSDNNFMKRNRAVQLGISYQLKKS